MAVHDLKCWPQFFGPILSGDKTFEMRREDRQDRYEVGDIFCLKEYNPDTGQYTGREMKVRVAYTFRGTGVEKGFVCCSVVRIAQEEI